MRPLKMLQVGAGARAQEHLKAIARTPEIELLALCDLDEAKLAEVAARFGIGETWTDMRAMIAAHPEAELVSIVTPPTLRCAVVEPALEAGARAILIEKPMALSPSEARRLERLGRERLIAVNTQYGWMPHYANFWPRLENGVLGQVQSLRASTRENVLEQGPHVLDLALRMAKLGGLGAPRWVLAGATGLNYFGKTPVPAQTSAVIGFEKDFARLHFDAGNCAASTGAPQSYLNIQVEITGTRGRFHASLTGGWTLQTEGTAFEKGETGWPADDLSAQPQLFRALRDALHSETWRDFPTSIARAKEVSDVMFACYASALQNRVVSLDEELEDEVVTRLCDLK